MMFGYEDDGVSQFNRVASRYDSVFGRKSRDGHAIVLRYLPAGRPRCVLDIGCGTGTLLGLLSDLYTGNTRLLGVDPAAGMVRVARSKLPGRDVRVGAAEALPFADGTADLVVSSESLGHWRDHDRGFAEVARILTVDGRAVVAEHAPPSGLRRALFYAAGTLPRYPTAEQTRAAATRHGLTGTSILDAGYIVTTLRKVDA